MNRIDELFAGASFHEEYLAAKIQASLQDVLDSRGMTRSDLAELMNVSKARVSQIFSDNANFTVKTLARACHAVGVSVEELLAGKIETKSATQNASEVADLSRLIGLNGLLRSVPSQFDFGSWNLDDFTSAAPSAGRRHASRGTVRNSSRQREIHAANDEAWPDSLGHIVNRRVFA